MIALLPDAAVRVVLLDFETLPSSRQEAEGVVRFRLKKSLPFDVEKAKVSYHSHPANNAVRVVAAVALTNVIEEYESVFLQAGYSPGVVLPSMLAALGMATANRPSLVLKVDTRTTSIAILDQEQVLLFRTLENTSGVAITGDRLAEEVYPSVVFFQDTYHLNIDRIFVAGLPDLAAAAPALRAQTGAEVQELAGSAQLGKPKFDSEMANRRGRGSTGFLEHATRYQSRELLRTGIRAVSGCAGAVVWPRPC